MAARSLNKVQLIGNLTRDPELRYTPKGTAVCTMGLATNRYWTTESGEKKEDVEFHRLVSWNKLAELCSQLLVKGRKIYVEGRLQTRSWTDQVGNQRSTTEVVIDDMIILDSRRLADTSREESPGPEETLPQNIPPVASSGTSQSQTDDQGVVSSDEGKAPEEDKKSEKKPKSEKKDEKVEELQVKTEDGEVQSGETSEDVNPDDIPF